MLPHSQNYDILFDQYKCDVVLGQENTDTDPKRNAPPGILYFRPKDAQSNVIYWNPKTITGSFGGAIRMSSPDFYSLRYLVWFRFQKDGHQAHIGSIHLPAFYNRPNKAGEYPNRVEYDIQEPKAAKWLRGNSFRILGGDINGQIGANRTKNLTKAGRWSEGKRSGPSGQKIDWVGSNFQGRWYPVRTQMYKAKNSDHNAVIVTFEWR